MIKHFVMKSGLLVMISLVSLNVFSQEGDKNVKQKVTDEKGNVTLIMFNDKSDYKSSDYVTLFKEQLGLNAESEMVQISSETDDLGITHERFQLHHKGVKVEFTTYNVHSKGGKVISMNGEMYALQGVNTISQLTKTQAFDLAVRQIGAKEYLWENAKEAALFNYVKPAGELVLLPVTDESDVNSKVTLKLAYKFDIYATNPTSRGDIYVDAVTGEILFYNATIKHLGEYSNGGHSDHAEKHTSNTPPPTILATGADTRYSGNQAIQTSLSGSSYILTDATRGAGIMTYNLKKGTNYSAAVNFTDVDNNWTAAEFNNTNKDNGALDAHWGAEKTYDYWATVHGRNSYNNAGAAIKSYVHYSSAYDNAFWNGSVMTYGDGSDVYFDILTSVDVAAHEIGHAVCTNTSNLAYQKESGAMNEGFSDIWGACVEYYAAPTKQTWLIGEDIERRTGHVSLRSMSNPNVEAQPDTYGGTYWKTVNCTPTSTNDYCGVHTNSGVLNHWFYILTVGKAGTNDLGNAFSVTGIGIDKAAKIAFRTESVYLTSNSTYANARTYGIQAATDLYGANSAEVIATTNAFYAVGLGAAYSGPTDNVAPTTPTNLVASGTTENSTNLSWSASIDNVGVTSYLVYQGSTQIGSTASTSFAVTGLLASTSYSFTVKAKDAAGNLSAVSNTATITTLTPAPDTLAPTAPVLSTSSTTTSSTVLSWSGATDNVGIVAYDVYMGTTLLGSTTATTYTSSGLTASTTYTYYVVAKDAAGNLSVASNVVSVTTLTPVVYCNSTATNTTREKINKVTFGTINNTSTGASGYENFTNISTYAVPGTSYAITIQPAWTTTKYKEGYAVFIDFNGNGLFTDAGETVLTKAPTNTASVSGTITIPATATLGATRMRVSMKYNAVPTACETFTYGQVEDYTVTIALTSNGLDTISAQGFTMNMLSNSSEFDVAIFPNPVENNLYIKTSDKNVTYHVMNYLGQEVKNGVLEDDSIDVSVLESGIYFLNIHSNQQVISKKFIKK